VIKSRAREIPPLVVVLGTQGVAAVAWLIFFLVSGHPIAAPAPAWAAILASTVLVIGMGALLARASARGDISIVGPVFALSPIFTVLPDLVLTGALPNALGWIGLTLAVTGTVTLSGGGTWLGRLRVLFSRPDARDALGAAVLLGFLASVDRWGALRMGASSYLLYAHGATALLTLVILLVRAPRVLVTSATPATALTLLIHGLLGFTGTGMQTTALTMAPAAYVNAIRRMSAVAAVLLGRALFSEPDVGRRLVAALLAGAGAACLLLAH
jgi:drug/metabolite transporter (DMT)-like permease